MFFLRIMALFLLFASVAFAEPGSRPDIQKIDPPNWWVRLPDPMLLVYGHGLSNAHFAVSGKDVRLLRSRCSPNGHYAFLWLATKSAAAQRLRITASNAYGKAEAGFELRPRETKGHQGFSSKDVMYLIMTDRFAHGDPSNEQPGYAPAAPRGWHGGDFRGIRQHLDYLKQLGITTLWITPVPSNGNMPESYHGYAAVDLYAVDSHFGTLDDYTGLANDLHSRGMKLVFDIVPNHIGVEHPWVHDPPTPDWFHGTFEQHTHVRANFEALVDPHAAPAAYLDITHGWFTDGMPDLNQENPVVSSYLIQDAVWWIESAGLDGLRIDTFPYVGRTFWRDFHETIHGIYPQLTTVGEIFNPDARITSFFAGAASHSGDSTGLDTPIDFPVYFTLRDVLLHDKPMSALAAVLAEDHLYPHPERLVTFFGNHDTKRFLSEPGASAARLKLAIALTATLRGMPELYSGDEIAMQGGEDPDNRRDFPGGFSTGSHDAFTSAGRTADEQSIFLWTSELFHLRADHVALASGDQQNLFSDGTAIAFMRGKELAEGCRGANGHDRVLVLVSKAAQARSVDLDAAQTGLAACTTFTALFPKSAPSVEARNGKISVFLTANGVSVYEVR